MSWKEAALTLQLMAEERMGSAMRTNAYAARAREDAAVAAVADAVRE